MGLLPGLVEWSFPPAIAPPPSVRSPPIYGHGGFIWLRGNMGPAVVPVPVITCLQGGGNLPARAIANCDGVHGMGVSMAGSGLALPL